MALIQGRSGIVEYTTTTDTGALDLTGAAPGWLGLGASDDGDSYHYAIYQAGVTFETGIGTYNHSARSWSRDVVLNNINGGTSAVNLGAGTKELSLVIPAERVAMRDIQTRFLANQYYGGYRLYLDADEDTWIDSATDDTVKLYVGSSQVWQVSGGVGQQIFIGNDSGAGEGPERILRRLSTTPANSDAGPVDRDQMQDASLNIVSVYKRRTVLSSATAGAHSSITTFEVASSGALQPNFQIRPNGFQILSGITLYTAGKSAESTTTVGAELRDTGEVVGVVDGAAAGYFCRNSSDGDVVYIIQAGTVEGTISVSGTTVTYGTFTGGHWSEWATEVDPAFEALGTVVSTAQGLLDTPSEKLPLVRPAVAGDRNVYGVIQARLLTRIGRGQNEPERALLMVHGLGIGQIRIIGPVARGDLLCPSAVPGVAEKQADDIVRSITVAKAVQDSPDDGGERLVPCVLMAG